ncbi:MAG: hypothetical protein K0R71_67 [Bacillales bacterium]|jgi:hypothetical protein|nr:hypothetical protein [Bacillales bacterium]
MDSKSNKMIIGKIKFGGVSMQGGRKSFIVTGTIIATNLLIIFGFHTMVSNNNFNLTSKNEPTITKNGGVKIPAIKLPKDLSNAKMIGLIVYNGKVYKEARTEIDEENAKVILGDKLGITKGSLNEWSNQDAYTEEFASSIGIKSVFSVKGYDKDFRIMTYEEQDGKPYAEFFENLNGITLNSGEDVFGKLKMAGNVTKAKYRTFNVGIVVLRIITQ